MRSENYKILGVTGGIAAGKSAVSEFLRKKGGYILDADKIAHGVMLKGESAYDEILSQIDGNYLSCNSEIDRKKLGAIVFSDKGSLRVLESIVHKHVRKYIYNKIDELNAFEYEHKFVVIDAPLLIESGLDRICAAVWVICASRETRLLRLMERNGLTFEQASARIEIQSDWEKLTNGGRIFIENNGNHVELMSKCDKRLREFLEN